MRSLTESVKFSPGKLLTSSGLNATQVKAKLASIGIIFATGADDFSVRQKGTHRDDAYHTTELDDALATGESMAQEIAEARLTVDLPALRRALGPSEVVEKIEGMTGELLGEVGTSVDEAAVWRYFTTSVYASGDLPILATREALQNSVDACRSRFAREGKPLKGGRFDVTWDPTLRSLTWEDNGIGMDPDTIRNKFLRLAVSGKSMATSSGQAAGGFGIAKAVILGTSASFRWELHTQETRTISSGPDAKAKFYQAPPLQGTRLTIFDVSSEFDRRYVRARNTYVDLMERLRDVLAVNDLDGMTLTLNGAEVPRMFNRRAGAKVAGGLWGPSTTASIKAYRRPPGDKHGAYYIRLGGLYQFAASSRRGALKADVVIDLATTVRPGEKGYPLNAARDALQEAAYYGFESLTEEVEREDASTGHDREYEIYDPESDDDDERAGAGEIAEETRAAFHDPDLRAAITAAAGGLRQYVSAMDRGNRSTAPPSSNAPSGSRSEDQMSPVPAGMMLDHVPRDAADLLGGGGTKAAAEEVRVVLTRADAAAATALGVEPAPGAGGILTQDVSAVLDRAEHGRVDYADANVLNRAMVRATDAAVAEGGGGLMQAAAVAQLEAPFRVIAPSDVRPVSPFGKLAGLRVSVKNYDRAKARRFRKSYAKWIGHLIAWDGTLRLIAAEARIRRRFKPGFVLDDTVMALAASGNGGLAVIYIHPDRFAQAIKAHKERPLALAAFVHGCACHELAHLDGRMGDGHSEAFIAAREDLGASTAHLLPAIAILLTNVLQLPVKEGPEQKQIKALERNLEKAKTELAAQRRATPDCGSSLRECQRTAGDCERALAQVRGELEEAMTAARRAAEAACTAASLDVLDADDANDPLDHRLDYVALALLRSPPPGISTRYISHFVERRRVHLLSRLRSMDRRPTIERLRAPPPRPSALVKLARRHLGPDLLRPDFYRMRPDDAPPSWGCCYVAAEAVYHAAGGAASGLRPMHIRHEGSPHWFLLAPDGEVIDPTADQFHSTPPYALAKGKGFLTAAPSARTRRLLARMQVSPPVEALPAVGSGPMEMSMAAEDLLLALPRTHRDRGLFHVVVINERTGLEVRVSSSPLTHKEGCVFLTKLMDRPRVRNCLQDASMWGADEWERTDLNKRVGT